MVFDDAIVGMLKKEEKHRRKKNPEVNKKQNRRFLWFANGRYILFWAS